MKDFFKNVAATIVGLFAFGLIMTILGFICIIGMVASSNSKPAQKDNRGRLKTVRKTTGSAN